MLAVVSGWSDDVSLKESLLLLCFGVAKAASNVLLGLRQGRRNEIGFLHSTHANAECAGHQISLGASILGAELSPLRRSVLPWMHLFRCCFATSQNISIPYLLCRRRADIHHFGFACVPYSGPGIESQVPRQLAVKGWLIADHPASHAHPRSTLVAHTRTRQYPQR